MAAGSQGRDHNSNMLAYLKVALTLINDNKDEVDLRIDRNLRLDDLDHLSSENMMKILMFLLRDIIGNKPISRVVSMTSFNNAGIGDVTYDCGMDVVYHAVKQLFPDNDELFHYSVLLLPSKDPKRTKAVLAYIVEFVLMCDEMLPEFKDTFEDVMRENDQKSALCGEIEDLKENINALIQERQTDKERLPMLQKEMETVEQTIRKLQGILGNLKKEMDKHKGNYEQKENRIKELQGEIDKLYKEAEFWKSKIVSNPGEITSQNAALKDKLAAESKRRESLGMELEGLRKDCNSYESLKLQAQDVLQSFESVIAKLNNAKLQLESYTKSGNELSQLSRKVEDMKEEAQRLHNLTDEKRSEIDKKVRGFESEVKKIKEEADVLRIGIAEVQNQIDMISKKKFDIRDAIMKCKENTEKLEEVIVKMVYVTRVCIPQARALDELELEEMLRDLDRFCDFPLFDRDPRNLQQ